jgi:hypothetical protein
MAATLGRSGIQPPWEGCFDPVITIDILELRIEEKSALQAEARPKGAEWSQREY